MRTTLLLLRNAAHNHPALIAFLSATTIIISLCSAFTPSWDTNDDAAMSMIAHGYGIAAYGSPNLVFSNVVWGYVVRTLPTINGILGYSLATMATLLVFGWATLYFLLRLGNHYFFCLLTTILLLALPTTFPQFTINAGLLTVSAIIGWRVYAQFGGVCILLMSCLLAFFGYLIRDTEFVLVVGVALPFLPWKTLQKQRQMQIAFLLLSALIASATVFDRWSYSGTEWQSFKELNAARIPFTDYQAGEQIKLRPNLLTQYDYSLNDVDLITHWFFIDPKIANPKYLGAMLAEFGPLSDYTNNVKSGIKSVIALFHPSLLPVLLLALLYLVLRPSWAVALAWILFLIAVFTIGFMGRPSILRIYVPLLSLLLIAPLLTTELRTQKNFLKVIMILGLLIASAAKAYVLIPESLAAEKSMKISQQEIKNLPIKFIFNWEDSFPYEYGALSNNQNSRNIKIYSLDSFAPAPFSIANAEQAAGRGLLVLLQEGEEIPFALNSGQFNLLQTYCLEHLNKQLHWSQMRPMKTFTGLYVKCT